MRTFIPLKPFMQRNLEDDCNLSSRYGISLALHTFHRTTHYHMVQEEVIEEADPTMSLLRANVSE
jgi:hypothetical protein